MGAYQIAMGGVVRTADKAFIPNDAKNKDWIDYQTWVGLGNTADAAASPTLSAYKAAAVVAINLNAEARRQAIAQYTLGDTLRWRESAAAVVDGSPNSTKYPMLDAEATALSVSIATRATAVAAEELAVRTAIKTLEGPRRLGITAVNAAANIAAVDAAVAAITWP